MSGPHDMDELADDLEAERRFFERIAREQIEPGDYSPATVDEAGELVDRPAAEHVVLETKPLTLDDLAARLEAIEERVDELDIEITRQLAELADLLRRRGAH